MKMMNTRAFLLASAASVAFAGVATAVPANLVLDPSFETTTLTNDPWSPSVPAGNTIDAVAGDANTGTHSLRGNHTVTQAFTSQTITLAPGIYQMSMGIRDIAGPNPGPATSTEYSGHVGAATPIDVINLAASPNYQFFSGLAAVAGGPTVLSVGIRQDPASGNIDDVSLIQVDDGAGNNLAAASQTIAAQASREFMDSLFDRFGHSGSPMELASAGEAMVASNDGMMYINGPGHYRAFLNVYGDDARWDSGDVRSHRFGLQIGAEWAPSNDFDIGISLADGTSHFKTETFFTDNRGRADEMLGALYANWSPNHGPFYATGMIGYGRSQNDFTRENILGTLRAENVDTNQWFGGVEIGWDWRLGSMLVLTPFARADGARLSQDGYTESATGFVVPAVVNSEDQSTGRSLLGLRASTEFHGIGSFPWQLTAKGAWQHEFDRTRDVTFSETFGATFVGTAIGATPVQDSAVAGASLEAPLSANASFFAGYNGNFGSGQRIHEGDVGFKVTW